MPAQIPRFDSSDPRLRDEALPFRAPKTHADSIVDTLGMIAMLLSGAGMMLRRAQFSWAALLLSVSSLVNQRAISQLEESQSSAYGGWSTMLFSFSSLFAVYSGVLTGQVVPKSGSLLY